MMMMKISEELFYLSRLLLRDEITPWSLDQCNRTDISYQYHTNQVKSCWLGQVRIVEDKYNWKLSFLNPCQCQEA